MVAGIAAIVLSGNKRVGCLKEVLHRLYTGVVCIKTFLLIEAVVGILEESLHCLGLLKGVGAKGVGIEVVALVNVGVGLLVLVEGLHVLYCCGPGIVGEIDGCGKGVGAVGDGGHHLVVFIEEGVYILHLSLYYGTLSTHLGHKHEGIVLDDIVVHIGELGGGVDNLAEVECVGDVGLQHVEGTIDRRNVPLLTGNNLHILDSVVGCIIDCILAVGQGDTLGLGVAAAVVEEGEVVLSELLLYHLVDVGCSHAVAGSVELSGLVEFVNPVGGNIGAVLGSPDCERLSSLE